MNSLGVKIAGLLFLLDFVELLHCVELYEVGNGHVPAADAANQFVVYYFNVDFFGAEGVKALVDSDKFDWVRVLIEEFGQTLVHLVAFF